MDEGNIDLSKTMLELGINDYPDQLTPTEKTATVRMLLQSRSGIYIEAACETQDAKDTRPRYKFRMILPAVMLLLN